MDRYNNLSQPEGLKLLKNLIGRFERFLNENKDNSRLGLYFRSGCLDDFVAKKEKLSRFTYSLHLTVNDVSFFVAQYELDSRFSLELSEREASRVQDLLANETLFSCLGFGLQFLIREKRQKNTTMTIYLKESIDKRFLPLN